MCRFTLYLGSPILVSSLLTEPEHSLIRQSVHSREREEPLNGDGFGIAWYAPEITDRPAVFKDVSPAWSNVNLANLARVTRTGCLLAHVRAATPGLPVTQLNCHPFGWERFAFMHNGYVGDFARLVRPLRAGLTEDAYHLVRGSTDSEHLLALFAEAWTVAADDDPLERMIAGLRGAVAKLLALRVEAGVTAPVQLNLAIADGARAVVTRLAVPDGETPNSLYLHTGREYVCEDGVCRMVPAPAEHTAVIVTSEPLSAGPGWTTVPADSLVAVHEDLTVETRPFEL